MKIERKSLEVLKECWGNYTNEYINSLYKCTSEGSNFLQKQFDGILFSFSLHVIPKGMVFNRNTALSTEFRGINSNSAFLYKAPPAVREWIYRDSYCLWAVSVWPKTDQMCMPCCKFWPVAESLCGFNLIYDTFNQCRSYLELFMEQIKYI